MLKLFAVVALFLACGQPKQAPAKANPCATNSSTYLVRYADKSGGNCGAIPDTILNISANGSIAGDAPKCDASEQDGCTARSTNCEATKNGVDCTFTASVTFSDDGSSASGLETVSCDASTTSNFVSACLSTYTVTMTRQ